MHETPTLPSLERARSLGLEVTTRSFFGGESNLLAREPDEESMQLAIVVRALVQHRGVSDARIALSAEAVKRLRDAGLEAPKRGRFERYVQQGLVKVHDRNGRACAHCTMRPARANTAAWMPGPGRNPCSACGGSGKMSIGDDLYAPCVACNGTGTTVCGPCDGTGQVFDVTARTLSVGVGELEFVFLPAMPPSLHAAISQFLLGVDALPARYAFDIERPVVTENVSYRTHIPAGPPRIYGIEASGPLYEARTAFQRLSGGREVIDRAVECFAVPFCMLRFGETKLALVLLEPTSLVILKADEET